MPTTQPLQEQMKRGKKRLDEIEDRAPKQLKIFNLKSNESKKGEIPNPKTTTTNPSLTNTRRTKTK